jgi:hypothetical protein
MDLPVYQYQLLYSRLPLLSHLSRLAYLYIYLYLPEVYFISAYFTFSLHSVYLHTPIRYLSFLHYSLAHITYSYILYLSYLAITLLFLDTRYLSEICQYPADTYHYIHSSTYYVYLLSYLPKVVHISYKYIYIIFTSYRHPRLDYSADTYTYSH